MLQTKVKIRESGEERMKKGERGKRRERQRPETSRSDQKQHRLTFGGGLASIPENLQGKGLMVRWRGLYADDLWYLKRTGGVCDLLRGSIKQYPTIDAQDLLGRYNTTFATPFRAMALLSCRH